jgi:phytoene desaturase
MPNGHPHTHARPRAAVIGSGFGGLACAIRLQANGVQTTLFEARDKPGGRAYVYEDQGYVFDAGPTVITAPECLEELFTLAGRKMSDYVELMPVNPLYSLRWEDGTHFDYVADAKAMREQIGRLRPSDADGYEAFLKYSKRVFDKGYTELSAHPFLNFTDMIKVAPDLIALRADRSVYQTVSRFVQDPHVRQALSFHALLVGGNPFQTSAIYTLIHHLERTWGVWFPRGGTGALVRALVRLFEELGGTLRLACPVDGVRVESERGRKQHCVSSRSGQERFDFVVSNADVHSTYAKLYAAEPSAPRMQKRLEKSDWSMSLFVLYFGTDKPYDIAHHTVLFGKRYEELLRDIFHGSELPEDFSLYLHAPTVTDPSLAPAGCGAHYVLSPVPHLGNAAIDWNTVGPAYAERILTYLEANGMPELRKHVRVQRFMTPLDFKSELAAHHGAAFSLAPNLTQSAWFRPHNRDAHIPGLYIVGAGTHPGAGVPGVVQSAKATAGVILEDLSKGRLALGQGARAWTPEPIPSR